MTTDARGRRALVTGAGSGIGAVIAAHLDGDGFEVVVNDIDAGAAAVSANALARGTAAPGDVTDAIGMQGLVEEHGPFDVLVNNAGNAGEGYAGLMGAFLDSAPEDWEPWIDVNFRGVLNVTHAVLPGMLERDGGSIVTILSDAARVGEPLQTVYAAAKAAAGGFSRSLAKEVGRHGVRVNCVSLGAIIQERTASLADDELLKRSRRYPMRRLGRPQDVAPLVTFLASDASAWITGQTYAIDGGYTTSS